jgi:hypothetical protein
MRRPVGLSGRRAILVAVGIGALGPGATLVVGRFFGDALVIAALAVLTGALAGYLTSGRGPFVGLVAGYGGAWAVFIWYYATFVGFREFDSLIVFIAPILTLLATGGFAIGRGVGQAQGAKGP